MLEKGSNDYGGHRREAIRTCREAIVQLKKAHEFRENAEDNAKDKNKNDK